MRPAAYECQPLGVLEWAAVPEGEKHRPWLWALMSTACLLIGTWLLIAFPSRSDEAERYERALRAGVAEESAATVSDLRKYERRRNDDFYVDLRLQDGSVERSVQLESGADWRTFGKGDEVTAIFWEGQVARIERPRQPPVETTHSPVHEQAAFAVFGVLLVPWSAFGLWTAFRLRRRSGSWRRRAAMPQGRFTRNRAMGCGAIMLASLSAVLMLSAAIYDLGVLALFVVMAAVAGAVIGLAYWLVNRLWRRSRPAGGDEREDDDEDD
ncbi:MAG TPA: hypothetical protein VNA57_05255 [Acidimicrobiales bacterium]|nr:hypothetical protein [Acidimicrobiales bacterium]